MAEEKTVKLIVLDGQSVQHSGTVYGPGESLELAQDEAKRLITLGVALTETGLKKLQAAAVDAPTDIVTTNLETNAQAPAAAAAAAGGDYTP